MPNLDNIRAMAEMTFDEPVLCGCNSLMASAPTAAQKILKVESIPDNDDLDAVNDTCKYIMCIIGNFNA